jgi:hypothetical protein
MNRTFARSTGKAGATPISIGAGCGNPQIQNCGKVKPSFLVCPEDGDCDGPRDAALAKVLLPSLQIEQRLHSYHPSHRKSLTILHANRLSIFCSAAVKHLEKARL